MTPFLTTHRLHLTPLSPIHIGCGEDFEPTNYVIDDGILYGFDPSRAVLNDMQRKQLADVARRGSLAGIQAFFRNNAANFKPHAHVVMPVCSGVADKYKDTLGRAANIEANGQPVFNKLEIERHVYTGAQQQPFIPGTSFKGALRTAWLDDLNAGSKPNDVEYKGNGEARSTAAMEKRLLGGDFQTSPLRLLKVADLMPAREPEREVLFAVDRYKQPKIKNGEETQKAAPPARKDCILPGQYRLFVADVSLPALLEKVGSTDSKGDALTPQAGQLNCQSAVDIRKLAKQSNEYHRNRLTGDLDELDQYHLVNPVWKESISQLLLGQSTLRSKLATGEAFLVRLGRYGGAQSKTLSGQGIAQIEISANQARPPRFSDKATTFWLAANDDSETRHLIPFGWAVVEIDPQGDCTELKTWCQQQAQGRRSMATIRAELAAEAEKANAEKARLQAEAGAKAARQQAERQQEEQRQQALGVLTPQLRAVEQLRQDCANWAAKLPPHGNYKMQAADANKAGLYKNALNLVKTALESSDWATTDRRALADMLQTTLPTVIAPWDAKYQRKKLQLARLREEA